MLGIDGMEGTVPDLFQGDLGTLTSSPSLTVYSDVQRNRSGGGRLRVPYGWPRVTMQLRQGLWLLSPWDPHPALGLLAAASPSPALSPWGQTLQGQGFSFPVMPSDIL